MNPYQKQLRQVRATVLTQGPEFTLHHQRDQRAAHIDARSEWVYPDIAGRLLVVASALAPAPDPNGSPARGDALTFCVKAFELLLDAAEGERWYHQQPGQGDANIDRFTFVPMLEAFDLCRERLPPELVDRIVRKSMGILDVQFREYGQGRKGFPNRTYPNMDAYYCLLMLLGWRLTGDPRWEAEFSRFLDGLVDAMFDDGGWTYIDGTNECPVYHTVNTMLSARIHHLNADEPALRMLKKSVPYYPLIVTPSGRPEYHTDPWWKHIWRDQRAYGPDAVASVTGDGRNRWIGDLLRERTRAAFLQWLEEGRTDNISGLMLVYSAWLWQDVEPVSPQPRWMMLDRNIEGPRGRFENWSWAATARYGSDTLVGAVAHRPGHRDDVPLALMAVTPEVPVLGADHANAGIHRIAMAMTPRGAKGKTHIGEDHCTFEAIYKLACLRAIWGAEPHPQHWLCRQTWTLTADRMEGRIQLTSDCEQISEAPFIRIRCGRGLHYATAGEGAWRYGPFIIQLHESDFQRVGVQSAPVPVHAMDKDCAELVLRLADPPERYGAGQTFAVTVHVITDWN